MPNEEWKANNLKAADLLSAMKQGELTKEQFATDIKLILDDYFVGASKLNGGSIEFTLLNGQKFNITVEKEKRKPFGKRKI